MERREQVTYKDAGVDIEAGASAVEAIRESVRSTYRPEVIGDIGGFGGLFNASALKGMEEPILVSGTDGVGTKLLLAQRFGRHVTVGIDLVAMCANDVVVVGAEPLFFLDYIAIGKVVPELTAKIVGGIAEGCRLAGAALIGGEMAEHPGAMESEDYDLSGFCVGVVDRPRMIDGSALAEGDVLLGVASSGLHSNGYSLVRAALTDRLTDDELLAARDDLDGGSLADALLAPTRIYARAVASLLEAGVPVSAIAHVTGGGITENVNRPLPDTLDAVVELGSWPVPRVIEVVRDAAGLTDDEAYKTFNMGIGLVVAVRPDNAAAARVALESVGESVFTIGSIEAGTGKVVYR